ncbi:MAG TPA: hypothetical protein VFV42_07595 [Acidimicrobiales bacterium]|nr:hypothetical protein [Acidimicrobiales bacterium]
MRTLAGLGRLVRLALRRDRFRLPVWLVALGGTIVGSAASLPPVYPDQEAIDTYASLFGDNPALVAFAGPGHGFDDPNIGVILVNEVQLWTCIGVALMSIFLVNRHTRQEEDEERTEVVRANPVGRHAPTAAAVLVVAAANVVLAAVCGVGFVALDYPVVGSLVLAASFAACGLAFTGIAAVTAQLASTSRASLAFSSVALGAAFTLRAIGDISGSWHRWLSPIGWSQGVRAFADERWWPLAIAVAFTFAAVAGAFWLSTRRDLGSGILAPRPGPARAPRWAIRPEGLALRLQRGPLVAWMLGLFTIGALYGSIGQDVDEMIEENPTLAEFLAQLEGVDLADAYFATTLVLQGLLAAGFTISSVMRLRGEEVAGRADPVLGGPVSRWRWAASHLAIAGFGTIAVVGAGGLGVGVAYAIVSGDAGEVVRLVGASLVTVPAVLVLGGIAVALYGASPRLAAVAWAGLAAAVLVEFFGELLRLPGWLRAISPLYHLPGVPAEALRPAPLLVLSALAVALVAGGLASFRRRDIAVR